jgi:hypothetical protein
MAKKEFITTEYDQFAQKTTKSSLKTLLYQISEVGQFKHHNIMMLAGFRYIKAPDAEVVLIDIKINAAEWFFSKSGSLQFIIDNENYNINANESYSELDKLIAGHIEEESFYIITKELLEKIASSQKLQIRINGDTRSAEVKEKEINKFRILSQQFYNQVFDNNKFKDSLSASTSSSSGCFIATAAMGSYDHPVVMDLRHFRDNWLLKREWGVSFTNWYYVHGSKAAKLIERSNLLKRATYILIVKPLQIITKNIR